MAPSPFVFGQIGTDYWDLKNVWSVNFCGLSNHLYTITIKTNSFFDKLMWVTCHLPQRPPHTNVIQSLSSSRWRCSGARMLIFTTFHLFRLILTIQMRAVIHLTRRQWWKSLPQCSQNIRFTFAQRTILQFRFVSEVKNLSSSSPQYNLTIIKLIAKSSARVFVSSWT